MLKENLNEQNVVKNWSGGRQTALVGYLASMSEELKFSIINNTKTSYPKNNTNYVYCIWYAAVHILFFLCGLIFFRKARNHGLLAIFNGGSASKL